MKDPNEARLWKGIAEFLKSYIRIQHPEEWEALSQVVLKAFDDLEKPPAPESKGEGT